MVTAYLVTRFDQGDNINFLTAALPHSQSSAIGTVHAVGAFHLPRKNQHGSRIQPAADHARNRICAARTGCHHGNAQIISSLGIAFRGNRAGLFVVIANEVQIAAPRQSVVQMHRSAAGENENVLHPLSGDEAHHIVSKSHALLANRFGYLTGRDEQHVNDLAHGAVTTAELGDHLAMLSNRRARVRGTGAEADDPEGG